MITNHLKARIRAGKPSFGALLNFGDPLVAEMMAAAGYEWLMVDTEHGPIDLATLATMFATITRYPVAPLVRVPSLDVNEVKRVLDAGAWGVMAPMMKTRADAELLVSSCKYPPRGVRSLGSGRFAMSFKTDPQTYFQRANDEVMVIVQIEHADAITNIDAMLSVPGVDACYVGPNDLMASMGLAPSLEPPFPEFEEAMQRVLRTAKKYGVAAGIHCATPATVNRRIAEGWLMTGLGNDQSLLRAGAQAARAAIKTD
ncbi:MAG: 2-dehydro-3-deoxyglucarate aldolase [Candidatus Rokubacteria bacterium]|nr:2-dehydro-3-deoxyglucarate aldolase [Candidatus Rokubacteria bacterium]